MISRGHLDEYGYLNVALKHPTDGRKKVKVHRLVMSAFFGDDSDLVVNHKDGNRSNNNLENLEFCTHAQNSKHASLTGLQKVCDGWRRVIVTDKTGIETKHKGYKNAGLAMGVSEDYVGVLCQNGRTSRKGFKVRFETVT